MTATPESLLNMPGAQLYYRTRGAGPMLLILAGGDTDADMTEPLCDALADHFTVVTYDRRGLSRSLLSAAAPPPSIAVHADDAHRLLAALTSEPAFVFGSSIGGLSGIELVARHAKQVRLLVVHEAPTSELLPDDERRRLADAQADMQDAFKQDGLSAAMRKSAELAAIDPADKEPDAPSLAMTPQREKNLRFLQTYDVPAVRAYRIDLPALQAAATHIVPAAGRSTRHTLLHHCADALAQALGEPLVEFPGGHTGWLLRPKEFAATLRQVLH